MLGWCLPKAALKSNGTTVCAQDILDRTLLKEGEVAAFVELHIEQGPELEAEGLQLGIVTAIAARRRCGRSSAAMAATLARCSCRGGESALLNHSLTVVGITG